MLFVDHEGMHRNRQNYLILGNLGLKISYNKDAILIGVKEFVLSRHPLKLLFLFFSFFSGPKATVSWHISLPPSTTFCGDLIRSMKKWEIIKEKHLTVDRGIFETPHNVENFLKEVQSEWNILHGNCYCSDVLVEELEKRKKLAGSYQSILK